MDDYESLMTLPSAINFNKAFFIILGIGQQPGEAVKLIDETESKGDKKVGKLLV